MKENTKEVIELTRSEIISGLNRQKSAEGLILQLPPTHEGRNTWLINYGTGAEAVKLRKERGIKFLSKYEASELMGF